MLAVSMAGVAVLPGCADVKRPAHVSVIGSTVAVRFDQPVLHEGPGTVRLNAARNEVESFQVLIDSGTGPLPGVDVLADRPLMGPGGARIPGNDVTLYREMAYSVSGDGNPPSTAKGSEGSWADALVPVRDQIYGDSRRSFPTSLGPDERTAAWVDIRVEEGQPSGLYRGSLLVRSSQGPLQRIAVSVRVFDFGLPSTSTLTSAFGLDWKQVCKAQSGSRDCGGDAELAWHLASLYTRVALDDRISIFDPSAIASDAAPTSAPNRKLFDRYVLPLLNGTAPTLLKGARLTSIGVYWNCLYPRSAHRGCLAKWERLARNGHFAGRFFLYLCDEPGTDASLWSACRVRASRARSLERRDPAASTLVTARIEDALTSGSLDGDTGASLRDIDILSVLVNDMVNTPDMDDAGSLRADYDAFLGTPGGNNAQHRRLWLYTSCRSYGCTDGDANESPGGTTRWPGYAIDQSGSQARALGILAFEYGATGELYYQTTASLPTAWTDQYDFGGNGSGTLFYPGLPRGGPGIPAIGGTKAIPIESIRLKRIRDGQEDYEYLQRLAALRGRPVADRVARTVFGPPDTALFKADASQRSFEGARVEIARLISGQGQLR